MKITRSAIENTILGAATLCVLCGGALFFKSIYFDAQNSTPSLGISKNTNGFNDVTVKDSKVIVPVTIGDVRYDIPAPYLYIVGSWDPTSSSYQSPLGMYIKGTDFSPDTEEKVGSENKPLFLWIQSKQKIRGSRPEAKSLFPTTKPPSTIEGFEEFVINNPYYFGYNYGKLVREKNLDRFGLTAYRGAGLIEVYAGQSSAGNVRSFYCTPSPSTWAISPTCNVNGASNLDEDVFLKYFFAKKYISDWDRFDSEIGKLFSKFKRK